MSLLTLAIVFLIAYALGRILFSFNTIMSVKAPCSYHTWVWDEELMHHRCEVCNHIAGVTL